MILNSEVTLITDKTTHFFKFPQVKFLNIINNVKANWEKISTWKTKSCYFLRSQNKNKQPNKKKANDMGRWYTKYMYKMQSTEKRKQMLMVMNYIQIYHCISNKTPVNQKSYKRPFSPISLENKKWVIGARFGAKLALQYCWEHEFICFARGQLELARWLSCKCRGRGLDPWVRRSSGEGNSNLLQSSCLEDPMNREARRAAVHGATKCWTHEWAHRGRPTHSS